MRSLDAEKLSTIAFLIVMVAVGAFAWSLRLGPHIAVDASPLADIPEQIGPWRSRDLPLEAAIEQELRADFNLQRAYLNRFGDAIWLYVGYYGTERGGRPEHTPRGCYTGAGWGIESNRTLEVTPDASLRVNEYLIERGDERRLVHFWYRSHRRTGLLGGFDQNVDRMLGQLVDRRADGALVRISTVIRDDDPTSARSRLLSFASRIDPLLAEHWPVEHACSGGDADGCNEGTSIGAAVDPDHEVSNRSVADRDELAGGDAR